MHCRLAIPCLLLLLQSVAYGRSLPAPAPAPLAWTPGLALQEEKEREPGPADLQEAIEIALKRYGGEAAGASTVVREGKEVHEIRVLLDDGRVRTVRINPDTGAIIPQETRQD
jgi:uncharacterized iron-regulated membrane protein